MKFRVFRITASVKDSVTVEVLRLNVKPVNSGERLSGVTVLAWRASSMGLSLTAMPTMSTTRRSVWVRKQELTFRHSRNDLMADASSSDKSTTTVCPCGPFTVLATKV